ncbi:minor tail protein [Gordonia phage Pleakley]|uniref:Glycine-rich domain-containing protein n=1 Tax=Gordonia phage Pleakley TaxID=2283246 RepID=A0A345M6H1_9CAUD|nr:minor tail protein [Gordonia phage Pleakley]AXH49779.1 hypothetical protein SEA_FURY_53 [Gordonia phage Fury]AXH66092.1 hypothetical protein SEA_PLEAKLEY_53 [Gordonia phage Pleakley]
MWSPTPVPDEDVNHGLGWSADGPPDVPIDPVVGWWVKKQLLGQSISYAEFTAVIKAYLTALSAAQASFPTQVFVHLFGTHYARGGFEGGAEVADALLKAYLDAWTRVSAEFTARAVLAPKGTYVASAVFTAAIKARLTAQSVGVLVSTANPFTHLAGTVSGLSVPSAAAAFSAAGPALTTYSTSGAFSYPIPPWALYIDIILLGAGGGGSGGNSFGADGRGGFAGSWNAIRLVRGSDIPWTESTITGTVGTRGNGGARGNGAGTAGTATSATSASAGTLSADGGGGASGTNPVGGNYVNGLSPGDYSFQGQNYTGGAQVGKDTDGSAPGGGGGAGSGGVFGGDKAGRPGAPGRAIFRAYQ